MQEILRGCGDRYGYDDQVAALADLLDMHVYFSPVQEDSSQGEGLPHCQIGNAVFSRYPILEADYEILPWTLDYQRGVQDLLVNLRGVPLRIYNTHLQNNPTSPQAKQDRTDQVRAILAHAGELEEPTVLTGDLNSNPDWSEIQPLFGDSWVAGDGGPGYTLDNRRIDYVLHSTDMGVQRTQVVPVVPSDHEQVVSDLLLPVRQRGRH